MSDYISRQAAIDAAREELESGTYFDIPSKIEALPSAPERKRGKWEIYVISMLDGEGCRCSECGFEGAPYWDFCPNCGSYNGGEQE